MKTKKSMTYIIAHVPKRMRVVVFISKSRIHSPGKKDHGKVHSAWIAADVRGYHVSQGETAVQAVNSLLHVVCGTNLMAWEERQKGNKVIRSTKKLLPENERLAMEAAARKTGFILDGVEVPDFRKHFKLDKKKIS